MIAAPPVTLRLVEESDTDFLRKVYASTREQELNYTDWSPEQKEQFCLQQFAAQDDHYRKHYPAAEFFIIEREGIPAGRLLVDRRPTDIHILDIALLPEHRKAGFGTFLLEQLLAEARTAGKTVSIYVEKFNRARSLYERLGFTYVKEEISIYHLMEWRPPL